MSYFDDLTPNSYTADGVRAEFVLLHTNSAEGKNTTVHHYPYSSSWLVEQYSPTPQRLSLRCRVIGLKWQEKRDTLISALKKPGAGELSHSRYGVLKVRPERWHIEETCDRLGQAIFSIEFILEGLTESAVFSKESLSKAQEATISVTKKAIEEEYGKQFSLTGAIGSTVDTIVTAIDTVVQFVGQVNRTLLAPFEESARIQQEINRFKGSVRSLLNSPTQIASQFISLQSSVINLATTTAEGVTDSTVTAWLSFIRVSESLYRAIPLPPATGRQEKIVAQNNQATIDLAVVGSVVALSELLPKRDFLSRDQALKEIERYNRYAQKSNQSENGELYSAVNKMKSLTTELAKELSLKLAEEKRVSLTDTQTALNLAVDLNTEREQLEGFNRFRHPFFVTGEVVYV